MESPKINSLVLKSIGFKAFEDEEDNEIYAFAEAGENGYIDIIAYFEENHQKFYLRADPPNSHVLIENLAQLNQLTNNNFICHLQETSAKSL